MSDQAVVFVHGIWMKGGVLLPLAQRVRPHGYRTHLFSYKSLAKTPAENAAELNTFLQSIQASEIHLIAHSLGGLVLKHLMHSHSPQKIGKVIMLGTPIAGSEVARRFNQHDFTRMLLGRATTSGLLGDAPRWPVKKPLAMIAGNRGIGAGAVLTGGFKGVSDGTVRLEETMSDEISHRYEVPFSHMGMLYAPKVVKAVLSYLEHGDFDHLV